MSPLAFMKEGESAEIVKISGCFQLGRPNRGTEDGHLADLGLRPGRKIAMIANGGSGPLVVRLEETRIALGRGMALKIYVRRNER